MTNGKLPSGRLDSVAALVKAIWSKRVGDFKPSKRQERLIAKAIDRADKALTDGHFAPSELVRRMTVEGQVLPSPGPGDSGKQDQLDQLPFQFVLAAAVDEPVTTQSASLQSSLQSCTSVSVYEMRRRIVLMEFNMLATSGDDAMKEALHGILTAFPSADIIDASDADAYVCQLVDVTTGEAPNNRDLNRILHCHTPSDDSRFLALESVDGFVESLLPEGPPRRGSVRYVEGEVFEVMPVLRLAHLHTLDGRMFGMLATTPGVDDFDAIEEGQRFMMLVGPRFNLVLHAERLP